jgi:hypothetical protein
MRYQLSRSRVMSPALACGGCPMGRQGSITKLLSRRGGTKLTKLGRQGSGEGKSKGWEPGRFRAEDCRGLKRGRQRSCADKCVSKWKFGNEETGERLTPPGAGPAPATTETISAKWSLGTRGSGHDGFAAIFSGGDAEMFSEEAGEIVDVGVADFFRDFLE